MNAVQQANRAREVGRMAARYFSDTGLPQVGAVLQDGTEWHATRLNIPSAARMHIRLKIAGAEWAYTVTADGGEDIHRGRELGQMAGEHQG